MLRSSIRKGYNYNYYLNIYFLVAWMYVTMVCFISFHQLAGLGFQILGIRQTR